MKMTSLFKNFVDTYNRTYETKEGEDLASQTPDLIGCSCPCQIRAFPQLCAMTLGRGTQEVVHLLRTLQSPEF